MSPDDLRNTLRQQPFEAFRIVLNDGMSYEIRHPDFLMIGVRAAIVGLASRPDQTFFEQSVKIDLLHIVRVESLSIPYSGKTQP